MLKKNETDNNPRLNFKVVILKKIKITKNDLKINAIDILLITTSAHSF